ncbi:amino acid adenylation domain-containing protein [Nocardiopsis sp. Huas11]|uniref:non-ribosomal peptide synthetase n=1 Tax=Nocardiopsis sp. Huas11 TaxID=2183912 RepID=UPI000EAF9CFF|nr:non-ribosomal peptide synthetase [Nocardiopsis sp. Huas11]RKS08423.1 amino acid adenylation domain-containing protein [Nocardiopsis sp. Huas11]
MSTRPSEGRGRTPVPARTVPMTAGQREIWAESHWEDASALVIAFGLRLHGPLDTAALGSALEETVARHESLRTGFTSGGGDVTAFVRDAVSVPLPMTDLSGRPDHASGVSTRQCRQLLRDTGADPIPLSEPPLLRARLFRFSGHDHLLILRVHHAVFDGWSTGVLLRDLDRFYRARENGGPGARTLLPDPAEKPSVETPDEVPGARPFSARLTYWRRHLDGAEPPELTDDRPVSGAATHSAAEHLDRTTVEHLTALAERHRATAYVIGLTAFTAFLHRYTGQEDLTIGAPMSGRHHPGTHHRVGLYATVAALRVSTAGDPEFTELLRRVRRTVLGALDHSPIPYDAVLSELWPDRPRGRDPLRRVLFSDTGITRRPRLAELDIEPVEAEPTAMREDVHAFLEPHPDGTATVRVRLSGRLYSPERARRMVGHFALVLRSAALNPGLRVSELPLIDEPERNRLAALSHGPVAPSPAPPDAVAQFTEQAGARPDHPAIRFRGTTTTYAELDDRVVRTAAVLREHGVRPGTVVALDLERSPELICAMLAVMRAGAAYLPLDRSHPAARRAYQLADAGAELLVTDGPPDPPLTHRVRRVLTLPLPRTGPPPEPDSTPLNGLAYLMHTSGSTGRPKAVMVGHGSLANLCAFRRRLRRPGPQDTVLQYAAATFDVSASDIFPTLAAGATLCLADEAERLSPPALAALMRAEQVTVTNLPLTLMQLLRGTDLPSLRLAQVGGARCSGELVAAWSTRKRRFVHEYGPTEATVVTHTHEVPFDAPVASPPIGLPVDGSRAYVLDRYGVHAPVGVVGELHLAGATLSLGYWNRPALTAERFVPDPFGPAGARMYRTGDLAAYRADGSVDFHGRVDRQLKVHGIRLEAGEVEAALLQHPQVRAATVCLRPDADGREVLAAFLVGEDLPVEAELRGVLTRTLPPQFVPRVFVRLPQLPMKASGKVDHSRLPSTVDSGRAATSDGAALTEQEQEVADTVAHVLGRPAGREDDLFDLGATSFDVVRLLALLEERLGATLDVATLLALPTVAGIAAGVQRCAAPSEPGPDDEELLELIEALTSEEAMELLDRREWPPLKRGVDEDDR